MSDVIGGLFGLAVAAFFIYCGCRIASRLGYSGYAGLLLLIPFVNLVVWAMWALSDSPNERELRELRAELSRRDAPQVEEALHAMSG
jgi:hypothetical protein